MTTDKKIIHIVGARPQFIKMAMVSREIETRAHQVIIHTGQHFDINMSDIFFTELAISIPHYNLGVHSLERESMIHEMKKKILPILLKESPNVVVVYGDTNSTLAGALAASKLNIKLAHVEAGLRSYNNEMPEELNRCKTDKLSNILFCPTKISVNNLMREGLDSRSIINSGDVMYDAIQFFKESAKNKYKPSKATFALCTIHRKENTDNPENLARIIQGLEEIYREVMPLIMPLHPRTKAALKKNNIIPSFQVTEPVGYLEMISLISYSKLVITDSGGVQKEAFFLKKACLTIRKETEWKELINIGVNRLCSTNSDQIKKTAKNLLLKDLNFKYNLYGDGNAAKKIADVLCV